MNKIAVRTGCRDGIPVGLGYLAVSLSIGIMCRNSGLTAWQGFLMSLFNNAAAGECVGLAVIAADGSYLEMLIMTLVANSRFLLMSCALSQRFSPQAPFYHRLLIGYDITDESFSALIARAGYIDFSYAYGFILTVMPFWAFGTALGVLAGSLLPAFAVSAFSVAPYGMFISSFVPPAHAQRSVTVCVTLSFVCSYLMSVLPKVSNLSTGVHVLILTAAISALSARLFPVPAEVDLEEEICNEA